MSFYYVETDDNGVVLVGRVESGNPNERQMANLADSYPEILYFEYEKPRVYHYYAMEIDAFGMLCVMPQGTEEERVASVAEKNPTFIFFAVEV